MGKDWGSGLGASETYGERARDGKNLVTEEENRSAGREASWMGGSK